MESSNFWLQNQPIAYAVVNGLIGSSVLWAFWTPFITFLAQPIASAIMKQDICKGVSNIPKSGLTFLPQWSASSGMDLINSDPQSIADLNTTATASMWLLAALAITISSWLSLSIIDAGQLDSNHIFTLNLTLAVLIIAIELVFFVSVGLQFVPFNLRNVYDDVIDGVSNNLTPFTK